MKGLVVGGGSIGSRHLRNLELLGLKELAVAEPDEQRRGILCQEGRVLGFDDLEEGFAWQPDFVVVATPSHLHGAQALKAARKGCHLFIEKPISASADGLEELVEEVHRKGLTSMVGCNMRFHPGPVKVKALLEEGRIGQSLFARLSFGYALPKWRPGQDFRKSYSAQAAMGGGCLLDSIHEIDLAGWYLGEIKQVFCITEHLSSWEMDVEDIALLICRHPEGALSEIHLDSIQGSYERGCQIVGERGSIFWDFRQGEVRWFDERRDHWEKFSQPKGWQANDMYLDEMRHFLDCLRKRIPTVFPVFQGMKVLQVALAAKSSARSGSLTTIQRIDG
jgi:predicted dehydrogenase